MPLESPFSDTSNLCANFLIICGATLALEKLFDKVHTAAAKKEKQRRQFAKLFSRKLTAPHGRLTNDEMNTHFPDFGERVPQSVFGSWKRRFATTLIAE